MSAFSVPLVEAIWRWPLARVVVALAGIAFGIYLPAPLRAVVVLPIALTLPGYALLAGLRARRVGDDPLATLAVSAIVSVALLVLAALAMYSAEVRVSAPSVAHLIVAFVAVMILLAPSLRTAPAATRGELALQGVGSFAGLVLPAAAIGAAIGVVALSLALLPGAAVARFTDVSLAGPGATATDAARVAPRVTQRVPITLRNRSGGTQVYAIEPAMERGHWYGTTVRLRDGQRWTGAVIGRVPAGGCLHRLRITARPLARSDRAVSVTTWLRTRELPASCAVLGS